MKKLLILAVLFTSSISMLDAQKMFTRDGKIHFFSDASLEKIEATNTSATSVMNVETGRVEFAVLIKGFHFEKALMQEHFNENYMESDQFPKSTFKGNFVDGSKINWAMDGSYQAEVAGDMTIHGVTNPVTIPVQIDIASGQVKGSAKFSVMVSDYDISIPSVVKDNIAKELEITVDVAYQELKK